MVTAAQLGPVVRTILVDNGPTRADALGALVEFDLSEAQWRDLSPALRDLLDDPGADLPGLADVLVRIPLASVRHRLYAAAGTGDPRRQTKLLAALRAAGDDTLTTDLVAAHFAMLDAAGPETGTVALNALACLPIEDCGVDPDRLRQGLDPSNADARIWAAIALARLGDAAPLDAWLRHLATDDGDDAFGFVLGNPFLAYHDLAQTRPLPSSLQTHLEAYLRDLGDIEQVPHRCLIVLWALTGLADAEGDPLPPPTPAGEPVTPRPPPGPALEAPESASATAAPARRSVGELITQQITQARALVDEKDVPGWLLGNALVARVAELPPPTGVDLSLVVAACRHGAPIPEDQLGWVLGRALDDDLLDQFAELLGSDDSALRATVAHLLRVSLSQRGRPYPMHGAGPAPEVPAPRAVPVIEDEVPPVAARSAPPPPPTAPAPPPPAAPPAYAAPGDAPPAGRPGLGHALGQAARRAARRLRGGHRDPASRAPADAAADVSVPPQVETRRLQAEVTEARGNQRRNAFVPGQRHQVGLHIGPGEESPLAVAAAFPDHAVDFGTDGAILDVQFVAESPTGTVTQTQKLLLPRAGASAQLRFPLDVAPDAGEVNASVIVFQRATVLQSAQLRGPVSASDVPVGGRSIRFVRDSEVAPPRQPDDGLVAGDGQPFTDVDTSLAFNVAAAGEALLVDAAGKRGVIAVGSMEDFRRDLVTTLRIAVDADRTEGAGPGSDQQVELLRDLARLGFTLYAHLAPQLEAFTLGPRIQLISNQDDVVPLEFVYDYGLPTANARLTAHWQEALVTGHCDCKPRRDKVRVVCPLGFWGLRFMIERQLASVGDRDESTALPGQLRPGNDTLPPINRVLFAATSKIDAISSGEHEATVSLLNQRLHEGLVEASSWTAWHSAIRSHRPGLVLSLPHTAKIGDLVALQIGETSIREVAALTDDYVVPPDCPVGPVVFLLGCSTANEGIPWQSSVAQFRRGGASLVVGSVVETLGRQTAPMARMLADQLWGPQAATGTTVGETLREVRRRLVAGGATLGLSLVVFGQSSWRLPAPGG
jgi:hypothetical protein